MAVTANNVHTGYLDEKVAKLARDLDWLHSHLAGDGTDASYARECLDEIERTAQSIAREAQAQSGLI